MKVIDPQTATLTNIEVLAFLTANPPRRPPNPPPGARNWMPSPDLRDHNTVVKEIHNYIHRLSPHLLNYRRDGLPKTTDKALDTAFRTLISKLYPHSLTKAEVLMIVNLGIGVKAIPISAAPDSIQGQAQEQGQAQGLEGEAVEEGADDYGARALLDTVIEEREARLSDEDVTAILEAIRKTLGPAGS